MSGAPVQSAGRTAPCWGLLGAVALVALIEWRIARDPEYVGNLAASWRFKDRQLTEHARPHEILCFGDSMLQFGVFPRVLAERSGRRGYNFAVHGGPAPVSFFLLRRVLKLRARPSLVIADFSRDLLEERPSSKSRPFSWPDLLTLRESAELAWSARDAGLFATILVGWFPSYHGRFEIRASLRAALEGRETGQRGITLGLWRNWAFNDGAQVNSQVAGSRDGLGPPLATGPWRCDSTNALYVEKFLDLTEQHGITVVWLLPPVSPEMQVASERSGNEARYTRFVRAVQARHANLIVFDGRESGYEATLFSDRIHLHRFGAIALTDGIADVLNEHPDLARGASRWRALPAPHARSLRAPMEDLGESLLYARRHRSRALR